MNGLVVFCAGCVLLYCCVSWLLPKILAWLFKRKFHIDVRIGRIGIPSPKLKDVSISSNGFSLHIDEIGLRSSFFSSEVTKLLAIVLKDVRINKDICASTTSTRSSVGSPLDFRGSRIPPFVIAVAQFMAIHVYNITAMLLRAKSPEWLVHAAAGELHIDGSVVQSARALLVSISLGNASAKLLRHVDDAEDDHQPCLGELAFAVSTEATLALQGPLSVERLYLAMANTKAVINDGLYYFACQRHQNKSQSLPLSSDIEIEDLVRRLAPIVPKSLQMKVQDTVITGMRAARAEFYGSLKCAQLSSQFQPPSLRLTGPSGQPLSLLQLFVSAQLDDVQLQCTQKPVLLLNKLCISSKLEEGVLNIFVVLNTLALIYDHQELYSWLNSHFFTVNVAEPQAHPVFQVERTVSVGLLNQLTSSLQLKVCLEAAGISVSLNLPAEPHCMALRCLHVKLMLEQTSKQQRVGELLVESLACMLGSATTITDVTNQQRFHSWGTPLFLGVLLAKMKETDVHMRLSAMLDTLQLEFTPTLAICVLQVIRCVQEYLSLRQKVHTETNQNQKMLDSFSRCHMIVTLASANAFFLTGVGQKDVGLALRLDSASLESMGKRISGAMDGTKLLSITAGKNHFACVKSDELKGAVAHVHRAQLTARAGSEMQLQLLDVVEFKWSCSLHLSLLELYHELKAFVLELPIPRNVVTSVPPTCTVTVPMTITVGAHGHLSASFATSSQRAVVFTSDDFALSSGKDKFGIQCSAMVVAIDGKDMFCLNGIDFNHVHDSKEVCLERENTDGFKLPWNRCWGINIASFKAVFPYEHSFAEAYQEELVSVVKWIRQVHRSSSSGTNAQLPPDLVIKVKEFLFEMSDDPFEVRLRDNLELLEDEYKESLKRQKMLDAKVAEFCKQHLLLPAGKIEELYSSLSKKNAEIYVQRSKQMSRTAPARTRLFAWLMNEVEIFALADPSIHGTDNIIKVMKEIDPDSSWPEEGLSFSTLWCRSVCGSCKEWKFQLRDFPQPLLDIKSLHLWGRLVGAEQEATRRARRGVNIQLGDPWGEARVERSMTSLKFYHDLNCDVDHYSYAFGPCWEPVIAQCNLSFEKIISPSKDPSPPLPFWDKMRLLFHGRLTMCVRQMTVLLHASLDPYNTTEEMELTWHDVAMDWTNAKMVFKGELNVYVRTASKYDDCRLLHLPNLRLTLKLQWLCLGDPCDHHSVMPCAPDKLPEYSSNQEHDSFRAFRSQNLNLSIALETKPSSSHGITDPDCPMVLLYGSTLRWIENLKLILSGVTRPTRRGAVFGNVRPRKLQLSRHYRRLHLHLHLHRFQVCYWMSFAMQRGCELLGGRISCSSEHALTLVPVDDGLKHRPRADWAIVYMNCELNDAEIWLKSALPEAPTGPAHGVLRQPVEKCYCLSVAKVSYGREALLPSSGAERAGTRDTPTHRLVVYDLKGAWTKSNRDVAFALFDAFMKTKQLKKNLSTEALKGFRTEPSSTPMKTRVRIAAEGPLTPPPASSSSSTSSERGANTAVVSVTAPVTAAVQATPSPMSKLQSGVAASMLQQLIAEADNKAVVFSDDLSAGQTGEPLLQGRAACREDDVLHENWLIALVNSQVLLKGCETKGYVILSAAKAEILQRVHRPVWKDRTLVSKTTWVGSLECMQYYATVSAGETDSLDENIMWLTVDNIQERESATEIADLPDVPHLVGSGQSVGGVVSETVGASSAGDNPPVQLQRIVSRCRCEFFYAGYGESSVDLATVHEVPSPPADDGGPWEQRESAVDAFTLMHHDLDVCTNSLQYAMILDVVNNLLLHVEPRRKEASERLQRMRFQLQLHSVEDQRRPIQQLQNQIRSLVSKLRRLERESYLLERAIAEFESENINEEAYQQEMEELDRHVNECKELLNAQSEELDMMISCYKETQLSANQKLATMRGNKPITTVRANEIVFKHAQWRLTEADGQLGIADLVLSNFLYTKNSKSDDSGEHLLELGYVRMTNLLPNQIYTEVLSPTELHSTMPVDRKRAVRIFCREKAPVGGISVKEHFEINVVPITIGLTKKFFNTMLKFCFPERDPDTIDETTEDLETDGRSKKSKKSKSKEASFYVPIDQKDDVEKMKERAEKNKLFIYIKIPEVPVKVSYKGNKDKNLEDIRDFSLVIPTLEYHNVTWTWLDLLLAMKNDSRRVILSQAIKQKLQIKMNRGSTEEGASPQEEDKARMLFGSRLMPGDGRSLKKGVFKLPK